MQFKPNLWKVVASLGGGIILGYGLYRLTNGGKFGPVCEFGPCPPDFTIPLIGFVLIKITLIYAIWSLLQKK